MKIKELSVILENKIIISSDTFSDIPMIMTEGLIVSRLDEDVSITIENIEKYHELSTFLEDKKFTIVENNKKYLVDGYTATLIEDA